MRLCGGEKGEERIKSYLSEVAALLGGRGSTERWEVGGQSVSHFSHQYLQVRAVRTVGGGGAVNLPDYQLTEHRT